MEVDDIVEACEHALDAIIMKEGSEDDFVCVIDDHRYYALESGEDGLIVSINGNRFYIIVGKLTGIVAEKR